MRLPRVHRPWSLTARLVVTAVLLVATVSLVVTAATAFSMNRYLTDRLDQQVAAALARAVGPEATTFRLPSAAEEDLADLPPFDPGDPDGDEDGDEQGPSRPEGSGPRSLDGNLLGQGGGTLIALLPGPGSDVAGQPRGLIVPDRRSTVTPLDSRALAQLARVEDEGSARTVRVDLGGDDGQGDDAYRVLSAAAADGSRLIVGLPTDDVRATVGTIVASGLALSLLGVIAAGLGGALLVRRQLRPLREVAATADAVSRLPLGSGEIDVGPRVPAALSDGRTEVGQVGAALNALLGHVEGALDERHRSEQRVRQFVADASHELRTPLTTIGGYSQLARRTPQDAEALLLALSRIEDQSGRMKALVEDLLLLARLDSGRPLEQRDVDLTRLVLESVADARVVAPDHQWRLDLPEAAVEVVGDELRLQQVVTNLLTNAARHTPPGTTVTARVRLLGDAGAIEVADDGPGLPPELAGRAFERFTRGDSSRTRSGDSGGAGLGLSLVQAIVEAHGGSTGVASAPGDTTFSVRVPLQGAQAAHDAHDAHDAHGAREPHGAQEVRSRLSRPPAAP